jgi:uncharacterized protein (DUF433 family)
MAIERVAHFPHIVRDPDIQGGEPTVEGTRIPVRALVVASRGPRGLAHLPAAYPALTAELIREALDFYEAHREEVDRFICLNETDSD